MVAPHLSRNPPTPTINRLLHTITIHRLVRQKTKGKKRSRHGKLGKTLERKDGTDACEAVKGKAPELDR